MILKPSLQDLRSIGYYLGKVILGLGLTMIIPLALAVCLGEKNPALDFLIGMQVSFIIGFFLVTFLHTDKDLNWMQGMIIVALTWIVAMFISAVPLYLSGHWLSFLDTCFDTMSGFATTGLSLAQDMDHFSYAHNLWRHLIMFIGGQGIIIVVLTFFMKSFSGAFKMYVGEARDEKILPNVIHTSRFIWLVSIVFLILGTLALGICSLIDGMKPFNAFFHGACIFMAAFDTGGFAPQSQSVLYYHSAAYEVITAVIMILGAINFKLHYSVWFGNRKEMFKNIESRTFFIAVVVTFLICAVGLAQTNIYPTAFSLFRKGFYQLISAHTGTGYQTVYALQFVQDWNELALLGLVFAMALGGAVCSTTGAIKMLRLGIILKALMQDIKIIISPSKAVVVQKFHHIKDIFLEDKQVRAALLITLAYVLLYALGTIVGMFFGYPFMSSLFESTSAAANVGLSCGITSPDMPSFLKVTYILQMWAGRLEFISILTLLGFFVAAIKGKE